MYFSYPSLSLTGNSSYTFFAFLLWCEYPISPFSDLKSNSTSLHFFNACSIWSKPSSMRNTPSKSRAFGSHRSDCTATCSLTLSTSGSSCSHLVTPSTNCSKVQLGSPSHAAHRRSGWSDPRCEWILSNHVLYSRVPVLITVGSGSCGQRESQGGTVNGTRGLHHGFLPGCRTTVKYRYCGALLLRQCSRPASWNVLYCVMAKCESPPRSMMNCSTSENLWMLTFRPVM